MNADKHKSLSVFIGVYRRSSAAIFAFSAARLQLLPDGFSLAEQIQVIRSARLGIRPRHVEPAEGVRADYCAGALAIDIQVAGVELALGAFDLILAGGVDGTGEAVLGVVGNRQ